MPDWSPCNLNLSEELKLIQTKSNEIHYIRLENTVPEMTV